MSIHHKIHLSFFILFILFITGLMLILGIGITPDRFVLLFLLLAVFLQRAKLFLMDWMPFLFILISYDFLRGFADKLNPFVHYLPQIKIDKLIFGQLPTLWLQNNFYKVGNLQWYDYLTSFFYFVHFALPLGFGFLLWVTNRSHFKKFTSGILYLSYASFLTFIIFPAAPPWLAAKSGYLTGIDKIEDQVLASFPEKFHLPTLYYNIDPNLVAAVPSLHAAYPLIVFLFGYKFFGKKAWFFLPYVISVWVALIYLGEHYFFDILLGAIYAIFFYQITMKFSLAKFIQAKLPRFNQSWMVAKE